MSPYPYPARSRSLCAPRKPHSAPSPSAISLKCRQRLSARGYSSSKPLSNMGLERSLKVEQQEVRVKGLDDRDAFTARFKRTSFDVNEAQTLTPAPTTLREEQNASVYRVIAQVIMDRVPDIRQPIQELKDTVAWMETSIRDMEKQMARIQTMKEACFRLAAEGTSQRNLNYTRNRRAVDQQEVERQDSLSVLPGPLQGRHISGS